MDAYVPCQIDYLEAVSQENNGESYTILGKASVTSGECCAGGEGQSHNSVQDCCLGAVLDQKPGETALSKIGIFPSTWKLENWSKTNPFYRLPCRMGICTGTSQLRTKSPQDKAFLQNPFITTLWLWPWSPFGPLSDVVWASRLGDGRQIWMSKFSLVHYQPSKKAFNLSSRLIRFKNFWFRRCIQANADYEAVRCTHRDSPTHVMWVDSIKVIEPAVFAEFMPVCASCKSSSVSETSSKLSAHQLYALLNCLLFLQNVCYYVLLLYMWKTIY